VLQELGHITEQQVQDALEIQTQLRSRVLSGGGVDSSEDAEQGEPSNGKGRSTLLGEILVRTGVVDRGQLDQALKIHRASRTPISEALIELGAATWPQIRGAIRIQDKLRYSLPKVA
jgi:hypothetical protein